MHTVCTIRYYNIQNAILSKMFIFVVIGLCMHVCINQYVDDVHL